jgi:molybdate transport system substrate-binding protein
MRELDIKAFFGTVLALILLVAGPSARPAGGAGKSEIAVYAAASLADVLREVAAGYETGGATKVVFNFAASNDLARQIEAGAPAHVFVSANREQVTRLERAGKVRPGVAFNVAGNRLVVIAPRGGKAAPLADARGLLAFDRLALADPLTVPAGTYARQWLERAGLWEQVSPRVVPTLDVRAALAAVAAGNLPAGVVYATDAATSKKVRVIYEVPAADAPEIVYVAAPVEPVSPAARAFLVWLRSKAAQEAFRRHGFLAAPAAGAGAAPRPGG